MTETSKPGKWICVPVEMTDEMEKNIYSLPWDSEGPPVDHIWDAAIAAAPSPWTRIADALPPCEVVIWVCGEDKRFERRRFPKGRTNKEILTHFQRFGKTHWSTVLIGPTV
jgi:hypothetical protein